MYSILLKEFGGEHIGHDTFGLLFVCVFPMLSSFNCNSLTSPWQYNDRNDTVLFILGKNTFAGNVTYFDVLQADIPNTDRQTNITEYVI